MFVCWSRNFFFLHHENKIVTFSFSNNFLVAMPLRHLDISSIWHFINWPKIKPTSLYYKNITVINDTSRLNRMTLQVVVSPMIVILKTPEVSFMLLENRHCSWQSSWYTIMIKHWLSIYTSMKHSLLSLKLLALALNSLDTLSDIRIKAFTLLF